MKAAPTKQLRPKARGGFMNSYWRLAYRLFNGRLGRLNKAFSSLEEPIRRSGIRLTYQAYICGMFFTTVVVGVGAAAVSGLVASFLPLSIYAKVGLPLTFAVLGGVMAFGIQLIYPRFRASGRAKRIDEDLPFLAGRMAVLAASGMTPEEVLRRIASDDSKDPIVLEVRKVVRDMTILGMDFVQALQEERKRTPSEEFGSFLDGMISTATSGANIEQYLLKESKTLMGDKRLKTKQFSETLGVIAEMYTTLLVVMPLILIILFAVMGVIAGSLGGLSITLLIEIVVYVMVPIGGIMIMVMADGMMPKR